MRTEKMKFKTKMVKKKMCLGIFNINKLNTEIYRNM